MKKLWLMIALLGTGWVQAQQHFLGFNSGGVISGSNQFSFYGESKLKAGLSHSLCYGYQRGKHLNMGAELLYQQRGFRLPVVFTDPLGIPLAESLIRYNYSYLAATIKAGYRSGERLEWQVNGLLTPAYLSSAIVRLPTSVEIGVPEQYLETDIKSTQNKFDLAIGVETAVFYQLIPKLAAGASVSFQHSLSVYDTGPGKEFRHYFFSGTLGLRYALGKAAGGA